MAGNYEWLRALERPDYVWKQRHLPATEPEIEALTTFAGRPLPDDYVAFLRTSNGAILRHQEWWEIQFWRTDDIPCWSAVYGFVPASMLGALAFADDRGGEGLVFDLRMVHPDQAYPVLAVNYVTIGWDETLLVAPDVRALLRLDRELFAAMGPKGP
jgi:hypothetical protein